MTLPVSMIKLWMDVASFGAAIRSGSYVRQASVGQHNSCLQWYPPFIPKANYRPWFYITGSSHESDDKTFQEIQIMLLSSFLSYVLINQHLPHADWKKQAMSTIRRFFKKKLIEIFCRGFHAKCSLKSK